MESWEEELVRTLLSLGGALLLATAVAGTAAADGADARWSQLGTSEARLALANGERPVASLGDVLSVPVQGIDERSQARERAARACGLRLVCLARRS